MTEVLVNQKSQYALRAVFELAKRYGLGPARIGDIARRQAIPSRFLQAILHQLKRAGVVDSRRGTGGGYLLTREPGSLTVGEVLSLVQGPMVPVPCMVKGGDACAVYDDCVFLPMWRDIGDAIEAVLGKTTFQDLLDIEKARAKNYIPEYAI